MANIRGTYEPPGDDVHIFDAAEEDDDAEGSRLPLLIVIALFVIAAFGGVVWLAYTQGVARGHSDTAHIITAQPGPAKVAANGSESGATPYKGLKIYQQPAPADDQSDHTVTPPPPETAPSTTVVTRTPPPAETATPPAAAAPQPVATAAPKPKAPPPPAIRATPQQSADNGAVPIQPATAPVHLTPPAEAKAPPVAAAPKAGGAYVAQIGAYKSADEANAAWKTYHAKHASTLGDDQPDVLKVDLGAKGTWFRLRTGSFADKAAAQAFCAKLAAEGGACFPAK